MGFACKVPTPELEGPLVATFVIFVKLSLAAAL